LLYIELYTCFYLCGDNDDDDDDLIIAIYYYYVARISL